MLLHACADCRGREEAQAPEAHSRAAAATAACGRRVNRIQVGAISAWRHSSSEQRVAKAQVCRSRRSAEREVMAGQLASGWPAGNACRSIALTISVCLHPESPRLHSRDQ